MNTNKFIEEVLALLGGNYAKMSHEERLAALRQDADLRRRFASHFIFKEMLKKSNITPAVNGSSHIDDERLGLFLSIGLDSNEAEMLKAHMRECSVCFLRMARMQKVLHAYASQPLAQAPADLVGKAKQLVVPPVELVAKAKQLAGRQATGVGQLIKHAWEKVKDGFAQLPSFDLGEVKAWLGAHPVLGSIPAIAVAAVVLLLLLLPKPPVKNFSLDYQLVISTSGPFGFVSETETVKYEGMAVGLSQDRNHLIFTWPEIPNASFYEIALIAGEEKSKITPHGGLLETSYAFPKQKVTAGVEYIWELSGKLTDGRWFVTRAKFVCRT
ncbi:MAG: hypothetical protein ACREOI_03130 [bacterium]